MINVRESQPDFKQKMMSSYIERDSLAMPFDQVSYQTDDQGNPLSRVSINNVDSDTSKSQEKNNPNFVHEFLPKVELQDFKMIREVGSGAYGRVYEAERNG